MSYKATINNQEKEKLCRYIIDLYDFYEEHYFLYAFNFNDGEKELVVLTQRPVRSLRDITRQKFWVTSPINVIPIAEHQEKLE